MSRLPAAERRRLLFALAAVALVAALAVAFVPAGSHSSRPATTTTAPATALPTALAALASRTRAQATAVGLCADVRDLAGTLDTSLPTLPAAPTRAQLHRRAYRYAQMMVEAGEYALGAAAAAPGTGLHRAFVTVANRFGLLVGRWVSLWRILGSSATLSPARLRADVASVSRAMYGYLVTGLAHTLHPHRSALRAACATSTPPAG